MKLKPGTVISRLLKDAAPQLAATIAPAAKVANTMQCRIAILSSARLLAEENLTPNAQAAPVAKPVHCAALDRL